MPDTPFTEEIGSVCVLPKPMRNLARSSWLRVNNWRRPKYVSIENEAMLQKHEDSLSCFGFKCCFALFWVRPRMHAKHVGPVHISTKTRSCTRGMLSLVSVFHASLIQIGPGRRALVCVACLPVPDFVLVRHVGERRRCSRARLQQKKKENGQEKREAGF